MIFFPLYIILYIQMISLATQNFMINWVESIDRPTPKNNPSKDMGKICEAAELDSRENCPVGTSDLLP